MLLGNTADLACLCASHFSLFVLCLNLPCMGSSPTHCIFEPSTGAIFVCVCVVVFCWYNSTAFFQLSKLSSPRIVLLLSVCMYVHVGVFFFIVCFSIVYMHAWEWRHLICYRGNITLVLLFVSVFYSPWMIVYPHPLFLLVVSLPTHCGNSIFICY